MLGRFQGNKERCQGTDSTRTVLLHAVGMLWCIRRGSVLATSSAAIRRLLQASYWSRDANIIKLHNNANLPEKNSSVRIKSPTWHLHTPHLASLELKYSKHLYHCLILRVDRILLMQMWLVLTVWGETLLEHIFQYLALDIHNAIYRIQQLANNSCLLQGPTFSLTGTIMVVETDGKKFAGSFVLCCLHHPLALDYIESRPVPIITLDSI